MLISKGNIILIRLVLFYLLRYIRRVTHMGQGLYTYDNLFQIAINFCHDPQTFLETQVYDLP